MIRKLTEAALWGTLAGVVVLWLVFTLGWLALTVQAASGATPDEVMNAYSGCLDRSPENDAVAVWWETRENATAEICNSPEARAKHPGQVWFSGTTWMPAVMERVRWCESKNNYRVHNPRSSASGGWQFLDGSWRWVTGLTPPAANHPREVQDAAAAKLLAMAGGDPGASMAWQASRHCWR